MYYAIRASVSSLHRESTDSLIVKVVRGEICVYNVQCIHVLCVCEFLLQFSMSARATITYIVHVTMFFARVYKTLVVQVYSFVMVRGVDIDI